MLRLRRLAILLGLMAAFALALPAFALSTDAVSAPMPPQVQELLRLLDDPVIRDWVAQQKAPEAAETRPNEAMSPSTYLDRRLADICNSPPTS